MRRRSKRTVVVRIRDALPGWYKLENYLAAEHFSLELWFNAFYIRQTVSQLFRYRAIRGGVYTPYWDEIQRIGAMAFTKNRGFAAHVGTDALQSLSVLDLFEIRDAIAADGPYLKHYRNFERDLEKSSPGGPGVSPHDKLEESVRKALNPDNYWLHNAAFVVVDLDATNETLVKRFHAWLKQIRDAEKERFRIRRYSMKDSRAWFDSGVLQFLDLSHWAKTQRVRIPDWLMGEVIFPSNRTINVSEAVRKTTRPLAERILSHAFVGGLASDIIAAEEGAGARKPEG